MKALILLSLCLAMLVAVPQAARAGPHAPGYDTSKMPDKAGDKAKGKEKSKDTACHQAVRGPHTFEHAPVVEDCTSCHDPHGSPNRRLLQVAQPMLCLQCHSLPGNRHGQAGAPNNTQRITGAALRDCVSCHAAVHGSSTDQHLRR